MKYLARAILPLLALCTCNSPASTNDPLLFPAYFTRSYAPVRDCRLSNAHEMHFITVAANAAAANAYRDGRYPLPMGSLLVKTLHDDPNCATPVGYVAMRKDDDWIWQQTNADFSNRTTGTLSSCIACHRRCADRDFTCTDP